MIEILFIILIFASGFFAGEAVTLYRMRQYIAKIASELKISIEETEKTETKPAVRSLETEVHNDILYLYDKNTRDFICQGNSLDELAKLANDYKKISGAIVLHNNKLFAFKDGHSHDIGLQ